jgi:predicted Zn-dependent protease
MADENPVTKTSADFFIEKLKDMVRSTPDSRMFLTLAEELRKRDEMEEAMEVLKTGVGKNPTFVAARLTLGRWYLNGNKFAEARNEFLQALELAPGDKFAARYLKEAEGKLGGLKSAKVVERLNRFLDAVKKEFRNVRAGACL